MEENFSNILIKGLIFSFGDDKDTQHIIILRKVLRFCFLKEIKLTAGDKNFTFEENKLN